jgi:hypothetical protein
MRRISEPSDAGRGVSFEPATTRSGSGSHVAGPAIAEVRRATDSSVNRFGAERPPLEANGEGAGRTLARNDRLRPGRDTDRIQLSVAQFADASSWQP